MRLITAFKALNYYNNSNCTWDSLAFGIAKGFGYQKVLKEELSKYLEAQVT
jgi:hypothetical protein